MTECSQPPINRQSGFSEVAQTSFEPLLWLTLVRTFLRCQLR